MMGSFLRIFWTDYWITSFFSTEKLTMTTILWTQFPENFPKFFFVRKSGKALLNCLRPHPSISLLHTFYVCILCNIRQPRYTRLLHDFVHHIQNIIWRKTHNVIVSQLTATSAFAMFFDQLVLWSHRIHRTEVEWMDGMEWKTFK